MFSRNDLIQSQYRSGLLAYPTPKMRIIMVMKDVTGHIQSSGMRGPVP